jgi:hypothetical protein
MANTANPTQKTMHGARAKVYIADPGSSPVLVGIFNQIAWGYTYDVQPVHLLGRFGPAELVYTAQEPVSVSCQGFRVVGQGAHVQGRMPNKKDLLQHQYIQIVIEDRQTGKTIATVRNCRPVSYSTTLNARNLEEISINYMGLVADDESSDNSDAGEVQLP